MSPLRGSRWRAEALSHLQRAPPDHLDLHQKQDQPTPPLYDAPYPRFVILPRPVQLRVRQNGECRSAVASLAALGNFDLEYVLYVMWHGIYVITTVL